MFVVWLPVYSGGTATFADAQRETRTIPDSRAEQFWDAGALLGHQYGPRLGLREGLPAWDVYLIFPEGVRWDTDPPQPGFWMHQLPGAPDELRLDGEKFAQVVKQFLANVGKSPQSLNRAPHSPSGAVWLRRGSRFAVSDEAAVGRGARRVFRRARRTSYGPRRP